MTGAAVVQLGAIAVAGTLCALTLRRQTPELALILGLVTACLLLFRCREAISQALELMEELAALSGLSGELLSPLVKTVGIALVTRLAAQVARDGGMGGVAAFTDMAGSLCALVTVTPLIRAVTELLGGLL